MKKKMNLGTLIIILVLLLAVVGMATYIIMDKLNQKNNNEALDSTISKLEEKKTNISNFTEHKNDKIKYEEAEFFDDYLYTFLPRNSANNFIKTITEFTNDEITSYIYWNVYNMSSKGGARKCNISKEKVDEIVYTYFGKKEYALELEKFGEKSGIKKISDTEYQVYWSSAGGWAQPEHENIGIEYTGNDVKVIYRLKSQNDGGYSLPEIDQALLIFNLEYSEGRYIVKGINYIPYKDQKELGNDTIYNEYLKALLPTNSANEFKRTVTEFTDKDITKFVYWNIYHSEGELYNESRKVSKEEIDKIVYDYFGKKEYKLDLNAENITQTSDAEYIFYWPKTECLTQKEKYIGIDCNGDNTKVIYKLEKNNITGEKEAFLIYNLKKNEERYIIEGIEYRENINK